MRVLVCPGCGVKIKIPEGKFGRFNCPKCGKSLLLKAPAANPIGDQVGSGGNLPLQPTPSDPLQLPPAQPLPLPTQPLPTQPLPTQPLPTQPSFFPGQPFPGGSPRLGGPVRPVATKRRIATGDATPLRPFLKRLGIGLAILSGLLVLLGIVGLFSEPVALIACFVAIGATLGLIVWGQVWLIVMGFRESLPQGLLVLFVPYYWIVYLATRKGRALQALALVISAAVPLLICLVMLAMFLPRYQSGSRYPGARRPGLSRTNLAKLEAQIRESHQTSPDADVLRSVSFPTYSQVGGPVDPDNAERILAELPGYVSGSFRFDAQGRTVAFQYRGAKDIATRYALFLAAKANIMMSFSPTFGDGAIPREENPVAASQPALDSSKAKAAAPVPAISTDGEAGNALSQLRTVSFQTLAQGNVDQAAAEQVLAQVNGYVAGSFRFDPQKQLVSLQYHGTEAAAMQFGSVLQQKLRMMVRLKPMFTGEP